MYRFPCLVAALLATMPVHAWSVNFGEALALAEIRAPALKAAVAGEDSARAASRAAGRLPDPTLVAGLENLPVSGPDAWSLTRDFMTMQRFGVMQQFPNSAKRHAERARRAANVAVAEAEHNERRAELRMKTAVAWIEGFHLQRQRAVIDSLERENRVLAAAVHASISAGEGRAADNYLPVREAVELADRRDELAREQARVLAKLRRYVGLTSLDELAGEPPRFKVDPALLHEHVVHHAELKRYTAELQQAEAALHQVIAAKRPDWGVELAYQRRAPDFGDMVSVQLSIDLPISPATRQGPLIESRQHNTERLVAEREDMLREHRQTLEAMIGRHASVSRQLDRARKMLWPALKQQVSLLEAAYRAGGGRLRDFLDARREMILEDMRIIQLESRLQVIESRLHFAYEDNQS